MKKYMILFIFFSITILGQKIDEKAPQIIDKDLEGSDVNLEKMNGKVVLLDFWASWCVPCRKEMPFLMELYKEYNSKGFEIVTVNIDSKRENIDKFFESVKFNPKFTIIHDPDSKYPEIYNLNAMPTSLLISKNGIIKYKHEGFTEEHKTIFREEIELLLGE